MHQRCSFAVPFAAPCAADSAAIAAGLAAGYIAAGFAAKKGGFFVFLSQAGREKNNEHEKIETPLAGGLLYERLLASSRSARGPKAGRGRTSRSSDVLASLRIMWLDE